MLIAVINTDARRPWHSQEKTMNITSNEKAREIARQFEEIKARGGHAAIDFCNGELVLQCTRPDWQRPETWGRGAAPQTMDARWVRLTVC